MKHDAVTLSEAYSVETKITAILTALLVAVTGWWLLSDREPTHKEMTFAYRKHVIALNRDMNPIDLAELRERLHQIELIKQSCEKLGDKKYRCEAIVMIYRRPVDGRHVAGNATYIRDADGFRFETVDEDSARQRKGKIAP